MEMKKRIIQELGDRKPAEVMELVLDSCLSADGEMEGLSEDFTKLEVLSLSSVGLTSLSKLPLLPKLRRLDLSDNSLSSGLETLSEKCPGLTYINLGGNNFKDLSAIEGLQKLPQLEALELDPEEEEEEQWREKVFEILPQICFLNGFDQDHNQAPDQDEDEAGPHDDDDDDDDDDEDEEEEGSDEDEVGLSYLMKEGIQDEEDDGDYVEEEEDEEEEEDGDEDGVRGEKRKRDAEDDEEDDE